jgi:MtrB/PioB family decaheme-associated outer membrane protein
MLPASRSHYTSAALGTVAMIAAGAAWGDAPLPDTSAWKCQQCPFFEGYTGEVEAGALYPNDANFSYGRYTGLDESKLYGELDATGQYRGSDGTNAGYNLEHVGLPYGDGSATVGREGRYDLKAEYDLQPTRLFETGATPYLGVGGGNLTLPASWVPAGSTGGMTALPAALSPLKLEYDRRTAALLGSYIASSAWTFHAELRHQEKDGTGLIGGSFLTEAAQLPQPIDYVTDTFEAGVRWSSHRASIRLTYTGSWFKDDTSTSSLTFANPYLPIVPGSTQGQLALPPDNNLQQLALNGTVPFDWRATSLNFAASIGRLRQNASFLPYSTLPGSTVPASGSLDGDVHLSHYSLGIASLPLPKLSVRGSATYDGRDDHTTPQTLGYIITDTLPGPSLLTPRYSVDRTRLDGSAD